MARQVRSFSNNKQEYHFKANDRTLCNVSVFLFLDRSGCDVTLNVTNVKQYFSSEGYPVAYPHFQFCTYNLVAPPGERIVVVFEDMQLQIAYDYVWFRESNILPIFSGELL